MSRPNIWTLGSLCLDTDDAVLNTEFPWRVAEFTWNNINWQYVLGNRTQGNEMLLCEHKFQGSYGRQTIGNTPASRAVTSAYQTYIMTCNLNTRSYITSLPGAQFLNIGYTKPGILLSNSNRVGNLPKMEADPRSMIICNPSSFSSLTIRCTPTQPLIGIAQPGSLGDVVQTLGGVHTFTFYVLN